MSKQISVTINLDDAIPFADRWAGYPSFTDRANQAMARIANAVKDALPEPEPTITIEIPLRVAKSYDEDGVGKGGRWSPDGIADWTHVTDACRQALHDRAVLHLAYTALV